MNATKRPWKFIGHPSKYYEHTLVGQGDEKTVTCTSKISREDAALIVRAVNAHDALMGVLTDTRDVLRDAATRIENQHPDIGIELHHNANRVDAALALAEAREVSHV